MTEIKNSDITFLIQGQFNEAIKPNLENINKLFPGSKVIFSTVESSREVEFKVDKFIVSEDPGNFHYSKQEGSGLNNINRQLVNTINGLRAVETKYAFKLRSDFIIYSRDFLNCYDSFVFTLNDSSFFSHHILACSYFTRSPRSARPYPFHISDLCFFGLTTDLLNLFDIPLMPDCEVEVKKNDLSFLQNRYFPEQYLFINFLRKVGREVNCEFTNDVNEQNIIDTEKLFAFNFILLNFEQFGVQPTKNTFSKKGRANTFRTCITHVEWLRLYKKYVDPNFDVPQLDSERNQLESNHKKFKIVDFIIKLITFFIPFHHSRRRFRKFLLDSYANFCFKNEYSRQI